MLRAGHSKILPYPGSPLKPSTPGGCRQDNVTPEFRPADHKVDSSVVVRGSRIAQMVGAKFLDFSGPECRTQGTHEDVQEQRFQPEACTCGHYSDTLSAQLRLDCTATVAVRRIRNVNKSRCLRKYRPQIRWWLRACGRFSQRQGARWWRQITRLTGYSMHEMFL